MSVRRSILGKISKEITVPNKGPRVIGIDNEMLLSRLLLFDDVVLDSTNLGELPFIAKMFGVTGMEELLIQGILKIKSEMIAIVTDVKVDGKRQLPLGQFDLGIAAIANHDDYVTKNLVSLQQIAGLSNARRDSLEELVRKKLVRPSSTYGDDLLKQVRRDLVFNPELVKALLNRQNTSLPIDAVTVNVENVDKMQKFETNLQSMLGITPEQEHDMLVGVVTGTGNINQRLADIAEYQAISQFEDSEAPLLFGKIHGVVSQLNPGKAENAFLRVIHVTDVPRMLEQGRVDVEQLLKVKDTDECREFRSWLSTTDTIDDVKLKQLLTGFRAKAASFIASGKGKTIRLGVNTGLGLIPGYGPIAALAEGAVDTFLLDKLLPSSGVLTFLNHSVPSIFKSSQNGAGT